MPDNAVNFFSEETPFKFKNKNVFRKLILFILKKEEKIPVNINYIFCGDKYLLKLNKSYLKRDTLTDVIAFDHSEKNKISGDIFISIERIKENAEKFNTSFNNELCRVVAHGTLHLCGYEDNTKQKKKIMTTKENYYLSCL